MNGETRKMRVLGIQITPWNIPLERCLQTLAAGVWFVSMTCGPFICLYVLIYVILYTRFSYLGMAYAAWMIYDRKTAHQGGRRIEAVRDWTWWHYFQGYFPLSIHKTADLPPDKNYLFCAYPHGMLCCGAFGHFATNYTEFSNLFPSITPYLLTINLCFNMPFTRELPLSLGMCAATKENILHLLRDSSQPKAVVLMVGGASEAFNCYPGSYKIILKRRKGFIKIALETGTPLVPVFSFGETDVFDQLPNPPGSWLYTFQEGCRKILGFAPCIPLGRGLFQKKLGLIPRRHPIATVVGSPIIITKTSSPSEDLIDEIHEKFTVALTNLFEEHKHRFEADPENARLIIE